MHVTNNTPPMIYRVINSLLGMALIFAAMLCCSHALFAQVLQGSLIGIVTDSSDAVIPNAAVTVVSPATGFTRAAKTNEAGTYSFNDLLPETYDIKIAAPGFATSEINGTLILANETARVNAVLNAAGTSQTITVTDAPPELQTDSAVTNYNITETQLAQLPTTSTTGRNYQSLYRLVPGATPPAEQNSSASNPQRSQAINQNGVSNSANGTRVDGAIDQQPYLPVNVAYVPPQDAIETVNIATTAFNAEQGIAGGAAVNVIMKSGTNQFHGSVFEYNSIAQYDARGFFNTPALLPRLPKNILNQYGGSIGGPIIKNKLFFFADWESTHTSKAISGTTSVPTAALRTGNFSQVSTVIYNPATGNASGNGKTAFAGNQVPVSSAAATLLQNLPLPNIGGVRAEQNNYFGSVDETLRRDNVDMKMVYDYSQNTTFYGHYSAAPNLIVDPQEFGTNPGGGTWDGGQPGLAPGLIQMAVINGTHAITPHLLLDGNVGFTRLRVGAQSSDLALGDYGTQVLGIPGTNYNGQFLYGGIPAMNITNFAGLGNTSASNPFLFRDYHYSGNVNLSYTRGQHAMRYGAEYIHAAINHFQPQQGNPRGAFNFTGGATTQPGVSPSIYNDFADFLLGDANSVSKGVQSTNPIAVRWSSFAFYAQDTWQVTQKLTLNYGVRYEYFTLPVHAQAGPYQYVPSDLTPITDSFGTHTVGTVLIGGKGNTPELAGINNGHGMFVPRLGINYRIDEKTVIRSGFGLSADPQNLINARNTYPAQIALTQNAVNSYTVASNFHTGIPAIAIPNINSGAVPLPENFSTYLFPQTLKRGYIESWNLTVERSLPASLVADVAYVGTEAYRQQSALDINAAPIGGGNAGRILNTLYGPNTNNSETYEMDPFRGSKYNGLQAQLAERSHSGSRVSSGLIYTYSKSQDFYDNGQGTTLTFAYPAYWNYNYGLAGYDRKHNFEWWSIAPSPFGKHGSYLRTGIAGALLGGWQLQNILSWYSGTPFTVGASATPINAPGNSQVADKINAHTKILGAHNYTSSGIVYFDITNYAVPPATRLGNSGRDSLRGPGTFELDSGLKRAFRIRERYGLELQMEAFNVTNTPQFSTPNATVGSGSSFGTITSTAGNNRVVRLSGRVTF